MPVGNLEVVLSTSTVQFQADMGSAAAIAKRTFDGIQRDAKSASNSMDSITSAAKENIQAMFGLTDANNQASRAGKQIIDSLKDQIAVFGMSSSQVTIYRATLAGVGAEATKLVSRLNEMRDAQTGFTEQVKISNTVAQNQAAAVQAQINAGNQIIGSLKDQIATYGMSSDQLSIYRATLAGVERQAEPLVAQLIALKSATEQAAEAQRAAVAAAEEQARAEKEILLALQAKEQALKSAQAANTSAAQANAARITAQLERENAAAASQRAAAEKLAAAATQADADAGQRLLASMREQIVTFKMSSYEIDAYKGRLLGVGDEAQALAVRLTALKEAQTKAGQAAMAASGDLTRVGSSVGQINQAMRMLPAQFTDVVTQLAGGQNPFLIMIQQGGQTRDMFGSFREMFTGLANFFTPFKIALVAVAGTLGTLAYAYYEGAKQSEDFRKALQATGNMAGVTEGQFNALTKSLAASEKVGVGAARDALLALTQSGRFAGVALESTTAAVIAMSEMTGKSSSDVAKHFSTMADGVAKWAAESNKQYHFITAAQYEQIDTLEKQGRAQEAMTLTSKLMDEALRKNSDSLGYLGQIIEWAKHKWSDFWDAAYDVGRKATIDQQINAARGRLQVATDAAARTASMRNSTFGGTPDKDFDATASKSVIKLNTYEAQMAAEVERLERLKNEQILRDTEKSIQTQLQADGVKAAVELDDIHKRYKRNAEAEKEEQDRYSTMLAARAAAGNGGVDSPELQASIRAQIHEKYSPKGTDNRKQALDAAIALQEEILAQDKSLYESREKMLDTYHTKFKMSDDDFTSGRTAARDAYVAAEKQSLNNELALLNNFKAKNPVEAEEIKKKIADTQRKGQTFSDTESLQSETDRVNALANTWKQYEDVAKAITDQRAKDVTKLEEQIDAQKKHNAEIGKTAAQKEAVSAAIDAEIIKQKESDASYLQSLLDSNAFDERSRSIYEMRLRAIQDEIDARKQLTKLYAEGSVAEASAATAKKSADDWKKTADEIDKSLTDAFANGFEKAKGLATAFKNFLQNEFNKLVIKPLLQGVSNDIASLFNPSGGAAASSLGIASGSTSGILSALKGVGNIPGISSLFAAGSAASGIAGTTGVTAAINAGASYTSGLAATGAGGTGFTASGGLGFTAAGSAAEAGGALTASAAADAAATAAATSTAAASAGSTILSTLSAAAPYIAAAAVAVKVLSDGFSRGAPETVRTGISGNVTASGFTGENFSYIHRSGGWAVGGEDYRQSTPAVIDALGKSYKAVVDTTSDFAKTLKLGAIDISTSWKPLVVDFAHTGDAAKDAASNQEALTKAFVGVADSLATDLIPNITDFQVGNETASVTLQRLATDYKAVETVIGQLGKTSQQAFGSVGLASVTAREELVSLAGGLSNFQTQTSFFAQNFLTEAEQLAPTITDVSDKMSALGYANVTTKTQFAALVQSLDLSSSSGKQLFSSLMAVAPQFAQVADYFTKIGASIGNMLGNVKAVTAAIATAHDTALAAADTAFTALQKAVSDQKTLLNNAYDVQSKALKDKNAVDKTAAQTQLDAAKNNLQAIQGVANSLTSAVKQMDVEQFVSRQSAQQTLSQALAFAKSGGSLANYAGLDTAMQVVAKPSQNQFSTGAAYREDQARTYNTLSALGTQANAQVSVSQVIVDANTKLLDKLDKNATDAQAALDAAHATDLEALDKIVSDAQIQLDALHSIDNSMKSVDTALKAFLAAVTNPAAAPGKAATSTSPGSAPGAGASASSVVSALYQNILGRAPDAQGGAFWTDAIKSGSTNAGQVASQLAAAKPVNDAVLAAYKDYAGKTGAQIDDQGLIYWSQMAQDKGIAAMQDSFAASVAATRKFDVGANRIPHDMMAIVHKDEAVIPAADNRKLLALLDSPSPVSADTSVTGSSKFLALMDTLTKDSSANAANTKRMTDLLVRVTRDGNSLVTVPA